jgi:hypothetical protein
MWTFDNEEVLQKKSHEVIKKQDKIIIKVSF